MTTLSREQEASLVRAVRDGDAAAFRTLFEAYRDVAFRVAWRMVSHRETALDAVQDGFVQAFRKLDSLEDGASFRAWLLRIVANRAVDLRRRRGVRKALTLHGSAEDGDDAAVIEPAVDQPPDAASERRELADAVRAAMDQLPEDARMVLGMYASGNMTYQEIADALSIPVGTVMSRLYNARKRMKALLGDWLGDVAQESETKERLSHE